MLCTVPTHVVFLKVTPHVYGLPSSLISSETLFYEKSPFCPLMGVFHKSFRVRSHLHVCNQGCRSFDPLDVAIPPPIPPPFSFYGNDFSPHPVRPLKPSRPPTPQSGRHLRAVFLTFFLPHATFFFRGHPAKFDGGGLRTSPFCWAGG